MHRWPYLDIALNNNGQVQMIMEIKPSTGTQGAANAINIHKGGINTIIGFGCYGRSVSGGCQIVCSSLYERLESFTGLTTSDGSKHKNISREIIYESEKINRRTCDSDIFRPVAAR